METCVLIPYEFSLALTTNVDRENDITVWTMTEVLKGRLFYPFQGTIRTDKLENFKYLIENDIRYRFGLYDEILNIRDQKIRYCNWIRFIKISPIYDSNVNMVCTKVKGQPIYETIKSISRNRELIVFFLPQRHEEQLFTELRFTLYRQTMDLIVQDIPLDLSKNLLYNSTSPMSSVLSSEDNHGSISSDYSELKKSLHQNFDEPISIEVKLNTNRVIQTLDKPTVICRSYLPCSFCGKRFDRPSLLKRHMRTHTGEKPHVCIVCGKGFSTSSSLNTHRRIHSGEKPHVCQICGKRFTASSNLYYHRMTHIKEKPHKCNMCGKSFSTPGDLKSHLYVHSGSWPFKCHVCFRGFSKQTNLRKHIFLHTGKLGKNSFGDLLENDVFNSIIEYEYY